MKRIILLFTLFLVSQSYGQKEKSTKTGRTTLAELNMKSYEKDTTARALVLYEHANLYMDSKKLNFNTDYYFRKKIFNKEGLDKAVVKILSYGKEKVLNIEGITYNLSDVGGMQKVFLLPSKIFKNKLDENWTEYSFTLSNVKPGSVIEYSYTKSSPYPNLDDWYFQSDIPKIQSDYDSAIIGNYKYNVRIIGNLSLTKDNPSVKKNCIFIDGFGDAACAIRSFGITDIPAFKGEDFMLSSKNYVSRLVFDLYSFTSARGAVKEFLEDWKSADKTLRSIFLNNQANKKNFFKKRLPQNILATTDPLEKAKAIYEYIQDSYTWNGKNWSKDSKMRATFEEKTGSVYDINLSLYNSLQAADIESYVTMISTRNNGIPTKLYPIVTDFNYLVVKVMINGNAYFLDATDKFLPFGLVPFKCLNGEARVMDFENGSFWEKIYPAKRSFVDTKIKLTLNESEELEGNIIIRKGGYDGLERRKKLYGIKEDAILEAFESSNAFLEVEDYQQHDLDDLSLPSKEEYSVVLDSESKTQQRLLINPFFLDRMETNPFTLEDRLYPVDFGYERKYVYRFSLEVPEGYEVVKAPTSTSFELPNNGGVLNLRARSTPYKVDLYFKYDIKKIIFSNFEYYKLKEYFNEIVKIQNSIIELKKT